MASMSLSNAKLCRRRVVSAAAAAASITSGGLLAPSPTVQAAAIPRVAAASQAAAIVLADGTALPLATFGVQIYDDDTARELTLRALEAGFRSFFTSPEAGNQRGFALAIRDSGLRRDELFIAGTVLSDEAENYRSGFAKTTAAFEASLENLCSGGIDTLDMLMLERASPFGCEAIRGQWRALEAQRAKGMCRSVGVCNFEVSELECLLRARGKGAAAAGGPRSFARYAPQVNQIGYTLATRMPHRALREAHAALGEGVALQAWGPLGGPSGLIPRSILDECAEYGKPLGKSASQVSLRWLVQQGVGFSVHSRSAAHLKEDLDVFSWRLSDAQMARLEALSERAPDYFF